MPRMQQHLFLSPRKRFLNWLMILFLLINLKGAEMTLIWQGILFWSKQGLLYFEHRIFALKT